MADVVIAQKSPYPVEVVVGRKYVWCACGRSATQPFCDGSHKDTGISPVIFAAANTETVYFCGCKHTAGKPMCDGSHNSL